MLPTSIQQCLAGLRSPGLSTGAAGLAYKVPDKGHACHHLPARPGASAGLCLLWGGRQGRAPTLQHRQQLQRQRRAKLPSAFYHPVWTNRCVKKDPSIIMSVLSNLCCLCLVRSHVVPLLPSVPSSSSPPSSGGAGKGHSHLPALPRVPHAAPALLPMVAPLQSPAALSRRGQ